MLTKVIITKNLNQQIIGKNKEFKKKMKRNKNKLKKLLITVNQMKEHNFGHNNRNNNKKLHPNLLLLQDLNHLLLEM